MIEIFTDGSSDPKSKTGVWGALIIKDDQEIMIDGIVKETTHNRVELLAVICALEFVQQVFPGAPIQLYADSQYVVRLPERKEKLVTKAFKTGKGNPIKNLDLVQQFYTMVEKMEVVFVKVKAHQKKTDGPDYNRRIDKRVRKILRKVMK